MANKEVTKKDDRLSEEQEEFDDELFDILETAEE
jgi:hypothetical protein